MFHNPQELLPFLRTTADVGALAAGASVQVALDALFREFGHNFNTIVIKNSAAEEISISLDGQKVLFLAADDFISMDWRDKIVYNQLSILNEHATDGTSANELRISVGRTGETVLPRGR